MTHGVTLRYGTQALPRGCLLSKCHMALQYTCKCNYIYIHKKRTSFTELISIKFTNPAVMCRWRISKFHQIWKINVETKNPFTFLSKYDVHFTDFHETQKSSKLFWTFVVPNVVQIWWKMYMIGQNFIYALKWSVTIINLIFTKLTLLDSFCKKLYRNPWKFDKWFGHATIFLYV
jgi:hypothetical protein